MKEIFLNLLVRFLKLTPIPTGVIVPNLYAIKTGSVNFFILRKADTVCCFDTGFGKNLILRELKNLNIAPSMVNAVFLTHSDIDHQDGLALFSQAQIYLSTDETQMVNGSRTRMLGFIHNPSIKRPYHSLQDDEIISLGSTQILAIATPGHTPGSMSYLIDNSILIVGDAFKLANGKVIPRRAYITMDMQQQENSIRKLASLSNIGIACTAHNGYTTHFQDAMNDWK